MRKIKKIFEFFDKKIDFKKLFKFGITGVLNTAIDWGVFTFCNEVLNFVPVFSYVIGYIISAVNSFFINKNWTFGKRRNYNKPETLRFIIVNLSSLAISTLGLYLLYDLAGINEYISKIIVAFVTIIINYFGNKLFVFK